MAQLPKAPDFESDPGRYRAPENYGFFIEYEGDVLTKVIKSDSQFILLRLPPQQVQVREPIATNVTMTQGGGKYVESRGMVIKQYQISGTTGYLPPPRSTRKADALVKKFGSGNRPSSTNVHALDKALMNMSGYKAFYELRQLFRQFGHDRREGRVVTMHFMDYKGDEYWQIEPQDFSMQRSSRKPFSYDYSISYQALEPSEFGNELSRKRTGSRSALRSQDAFAGVLGTSAGAEGGHRAVQTIHDKALSAPQPTLTPGGALDYISHGVSVMGFNTHVRSVDRLGEMKASGFKGIKYYTGVVREKFQGWLRKVGEIQTYVDDRRNDILAVSDTFLVLLKQLAAQTDGIFDVLESFGADATKNELNEFLLEARFLTDQLIDNAAAAESVGSKLLRDNDKFTKRRGIEGSATDLIKEEPGSVGSINGIPSFNGAGFDLVGGLQRAASATSFRSERVLGGENIYDLSTRLLGTPHQYYQIVSLNNLQPPYIVASGTDKREGVVAWGDTVRIPDSSPSPSVPGSQIGTVSPVFVGTVSDVGTNQELIDADRFTPWREDELTGFTVTMTSGVSTGEARIIIGNTITGVIVLSRPWTIVPAVDDAYSIQDVTFHLRVAKTPETLAFGTDILAKFDKNNRADAVIGPLGDLVLVTAQENFNQAINLLMNTVVGTNLFHRTYGLSLPIGRPLNEDVFLYTFYARQALFADSRVADVRRPRISFESGTFRFQVDITPVRLNNATAFNVAR